MSGGIACTCPAPERALRPWVITRYKHHHSAFNGYKKTPSAYSSIQCIKCGHSWRTKAAYVESLLGTAGLVRINGSVTEC